MGKGFSVPYPETEEIIEEEKNVDSEGPTFEMIESLKVSDPKQETIKRNRLATENRQRSNKMRKKGFCLDKEELNDVS